MISTNYIMGFTDIKPRNVIFQDQEGREFTISFDPFDVKLSDGMEMTEAARLFIDEVKRLTGLLEP